MLNVDWNNIVSSKYWKDKCNWKFFTGYTISLYIYMYSSSYKQFKLLWFPYSLTDLLIVTIMGYELIYANTSFLLLLLFPHFFQQCRNDHICIYMQLFNTTLSLYLIIQVPIHIHPIPIIIFFSLHHYLHDYTVE